MKSSSCAASTRPPSSSHGRSSRCRKTSSLRLVLVSGLSGSGKSIALNVLEDGGYYCVDNLPATLLLETIAFLAEAGQERVGVSIDARSAALPSLPEHLAQLGRQGVDCRVL